MAKTEVSFSVSTVVENKITNYTQGSKAHASLYRNLQPKAVSCSLSSRTAHDPPSCVGMLTGRLGTARRLPGPRVPRLEPQRWPAGSLSESDQLVN